MNHTDLTDTQLLGEQAREIIHLKSHLESHQLAIKNARLRIICVGGPLNGNNLCYSGAQIVTFQRILDELDGA